MRLWEGGGDGIGVEELLLLPLLLLCVCCPPLPVGATVRVVGG